MGYSLKSSHWQFLAFLKLPQGHFWFLISAGTRFCLFLLHCSSSVISLSILSISLMNKVPTPVALHTHLSADRLICLSFSLTLIQRFQLIPEHDSVVMRHTACADQICRTTVGCHFVCVWCVHSGITSNITDCPRSILSTTTSFSTNGLSGSECG